MVVEVAADGLANQTCSRKKRGGRDTC